MSELEAFPCPLPGCESTPVVDEGISETVVRCPVCGLTGPSFSRGDQGCATAHQLREVCIRAWNSIKREDDGSAWYEDEPPTEQEEPVVIAGVPLNCRHKWVKHWPRRRTPTADIWKCTRCPAQITDDALQALPIASRHAIGFPTPYRIRAT